jgi:copper homeostasis protein (lipoprotein)
MRSLIGIALGVALAACSGTPHQQPSGHNSQNSLDWAGAYKGVLPCASCPGIETVLTLDTNQRYILSTRYQDRGPDKQVVEGEFQWNEAGDTIRLKGLDASTTPIYYRVQENRLLQLDLKGQPITGALASQYVLQKLVPALTDVEWHLVKIQALTPMVAQGATPYIQFSAADNRVFGYSGCNRIAGGYEEKPAKKADSGSLKLSQLISTKMACLEGDRMRLEQLFVGLLPQVDAYALINGRLVLYKEGEALLQFKPVY